MNIKQHIPNTITLLNLLSGCLGLYFVLAQHNLEYGVYAMILGAILDFFDGFAARLLKVSSAIGKDLDSLADVVTFGVLPAFLAFNLIESCSCSLGMYYKFGALLIALFSALRLAKFNNDNRQTEGFIGLPTPANALFWAGMVFLQHNPNFEFVFVPGRLLALVIVFSYLLVSELPVYSLKFKNFNFKKDIAIVVILGLSCVFLVLLGWQGLSFAILTLILFSLINHLKNSYGKGN